MIIIIIFHVLIIGGFLAVYITSPKTMFREGALENSGVYTLCIAITEVLLLALHHVEILSLSDTVCDSLSVGLFLLFMYSAAALAKKGNRGYAITIYTLVVVIGYLAIEIYTDPTQLVPNITFIALLIIFLLILSIYRSTKTMKHKAKNLNDF